HRRLAAKRVGLVICTGNKNAIFAAHAIRTLRNVLKSILPVEIVYAGDQDLDFRHRRMLTSLGPDISLLDLTMVFDDSAAGLREGGWAMKPFAMLASRFAQVILMDADAGFFEALNHVFDAIPDLKDSGTLFWHDRALTFGGGADRHIWLRSVFANRTLSPTLAQSLFWRQKLGHLMDSAVVTKETFWLAAELSNVPYSFIPTYAGSIGSADNDTNSSMRVCSSQAVHLDAAKRPFWFNGSFRKNKKAGTALVDFTHYRLGDPRNMTTELR
ncbi:MAG: hypothetical protein Q9181_005611, partial [Wetmoreana brouardii]